MGRQPRDKREGSERKIRMSEDLLWGTHPVFEALEKEAGRFSEIILQKERRGTKIEEIIRMARGQRVKISFVDSIRLIGEGASQARHQGIVARISEAVFIALEDLIKKVTDLKQDGIVPRLVVCDSLQDPHNLGAIIRSALASGANGVVVTRERSAPIGGTVAKASAGAVSHIDICQVTNLTTSLKMLKDAGFWIFGAVKEGDAQSLYQADLTVPACLVVGSEGKGIRPLVMKECDVLISIPMVGSLDSLNSSVAAAVILFEAMRQSISL